MKKFKISTSLVSILAISLLSAPILSIPSAEAMSPAVLQELREKMAAKKAAKKAAAALASAPSAPPPPPPPPSVPSSSARSTATVARDNNAMFAELARKAAARKARLASSAPVVRSTFAKPSSLPRQSVVAPTMFKFSKESIFSPTNKYGAKHTALSENYPKAIDTIERIHALASKVEAVTLVTDPVEKAKLLQKKLALEAQATVLKEQVSTTKKEMQKALDEVVQKARSAPAKDKITTQKLDDYKKLIIKFGDLSRIERTKVDFMSSVTGVSRVDEKRITEARDKLGYTLLPQEKEIQSKIKQIQSELTGISSKENANPLEQQIDKIQVIVEDILGRNGKKEDLDSIVNGFKSLLRKGEITEELCYNVSIYTDKIESYVKKAEKQAQGLNFGGNPSEAQKKLLKELETLKQQVKSESSNLDQYSVAVTQLDDSNTSAIIITDDRTGKRILADSESISYFVNAEGKLDKKSIKAKFDKEYIQEAQIEVAATPENHSEVFEKLQSRGVELEEIDIDNSDERVSNLKNEDKALVYLLLTANSKEDFQKETVKTMSITSSEISSDIINSTFSAINSRLGSLSGIGASAEEETKKAFAMHGIWVSGTYSKGHQKAYGEVSDYKSKSGGGTIGVDFAVNDEDTIVGASYSRMMSNITADQSSKTKVSAVSNILSLYGKMNLGKKFDLSAIVSGNTTAFNHKYQKSVGNGNYQTAKAKFTSNGFNAQMMLNYKIVLANKLMITPMLGMQYGNQSNSAYTESGAGVHNLSIDAQNIKGLSGQAGIKVSRAFLVGNTQIIPSLIAVTNKSFTSKNEKIKARYTWASGSSKETHIINKGKSLGYNLGASLGVNHNNVQVLAEYNCRLKKKYIGHQGTLKLKLLF